ncbi:hypothetical protein [Dyella mobilis]|uniref:Uncharacterized protein n=1 Tax=Dyella mobilis TaxID=1849582 RepID=A0ABS2KEM6_9GAMM|nr:hypothetical protein [Dyella mobilis]MBM7129358.1 hypothetical protein [Dyella mobilis]GLQ98652.1 hypothetical protein GCM10007863_30720 [Dyella mobilis]
MKKMVVAGLGLCLAGCVTMSGSYKVTAVEKDGTPVNVVMRAEGSSIYSARNAICSAHPGATVSIVDIATDKELSSESPYRCK